MPAHAPRRTGRAPAASTSAAALTEVRLAGRGGQGVVTAGELLGEAVLRGGRHAQSLPTFGPERRGALAQCTLRISDEPILLKCSTAQPRLLLCLDPTIWRHAPITLGLREGAVLVFNATQEASALKSALASGSFASGVALEDFTVHSVDATGIALEHLGRPISNTTMLGALAAAGDVIGLEDVEDVLRARFGAAGEANVAAARAGYAAIAQGDA